MIEIKLISEECGKVFDIICEDIKILSNVTKFKHKQNYFSLPVSNYLFSEVDDTFESMTIQFKSLNGIGTHPEEFKKHFRRENNSFLMKIKRTNGDKTTERFAYVKKVEEEITQIYSTDLHDYTFTFATLSHWLEIAPFSKDLGTIVYDIGYSSSNPPETGDGYIYPHFYGQSADTLDFFKVQLPPNDGDKDAFLRVKMSDIQGIPKFGLNDKYDNVFDAYECLEEVIIGKQVVVNSFPPIKKIHLLDLDDTFLENWENDLKRNINKKSYLTIKTDSFCASNYQFLVFTNVRSVRGQLIKQFVEPF